MIIIPIKHNCDLGTERPFDWSLTSPTIIPWTAKRFDLTSDALLDSSRGFPLCASLKIGGIRSLNNECVNHYTTN